MTELELLVDLHRATERQGPGSTEDSLKALSLINFESNTPLKIAEIGCGTGASAILLAQNLNAEIQAIDLFPQFLQVLKEKTKSLELSDRIEAVEASMEDLPFEREELDLIWSEGAVYNMGFEKGIKAWKHFLKKGGFLVISEITWTSNSRPSDLEKYWSEAYAEIGRASEKISILEGNGYNLKGYFYLEEDSWENYYRELEEQFEGFLERHEYSEAALNIVKENKAEINLYRRNKGHVSYGFYIAQKD